MTVGFAVVLLVLVVLVALAGASFFQHRVAGLVVLFALPLAVVLAALVGTGYTVFAIGLLASFAAVIHTISDTFRLLRAAKHTDRRPRSRSRNSEHRDGGRERSRLTA